MPFLVMSMCYAVRCQIQSGWGAVQIDMAHETNASAMTLRGLGGPGGGDDLMVEKADASTCGCTLAQRLTGCVGRPVFIKKGAGRKRRVRGAQVPAKGPGPGKVTKKGHGELLDA